MKNDCVMCENGFVCKVHRTNYGPDPTPASQPTPAQGTIERAVIVRDGKTVAIGERGETLAMWNRELTPDERESILRDPYQMYEQPSPARSDKEADLHAVAIEAAQVLESAAAHNRAKGRTVLAHAQQDRADRLRIAVHAAGQAQERAKCAECGGWSDSTAELHNAGCSKTAERAPSGESIDTPEFRALLAEVEIQSEAVDGGADPSLYSNALAALVAHIDTYRASAAADYPALRLFLSAAYPVAREINPRGYNWCEAYLDHARTAALAELARRAQPAPSREALAQSENAEFTEWWNREQVCPEHSLITENAAHAAWQERARRATAGTTAAPAEYPHPDCDWACHYHCTEAGAHPPRCATAGNAAPTDIGIPASGECGYCEGSKGAHDGGYWVECPQCNDTGAAPTEAEAVEGGASALRAEPAGQHDAGASVLLAEEIDGVSLDACTAAEVTGGSMTHIYTRDAWQKFGRLIEKKVMQRIKGGKK